MAADKKSEYGTVTKSRSYSTKALREEFSYAVIDEELFALLQSEDVRAKLRTLLIGKYLLQQPNQASLLKALTLVAALLLIA